MSRFEGHYPLFAVLSLPASGANVVYFIPQQNNATYCNTTAVEIWVNAMDLSSGQINLNYSGTCANVTNCSLSPTFMLSGWNHRLGGDFITFLSATPLTGKYIICTLTIHCVNNQTSCETPLIFMQSGAQPSELYNQSSALLPAAWINGTFTCGELSQCLGTCCNDSNCTDSFATNVTCKYCVVDSGKYWKPNKDSACFDGNATSNLCLASCPQCCDSVDNDDDGSIDYPRDGDCTCGLDPSEWEKRPPIPELPTIVLFCTGLLMLTGYVLWKKRS